MAVWHAGCEVCIYITSESYRQIVSTKWMNRGFRPSDPCRPPNQVAECVRPPHRHCLWKSSILASTEWSRKVRGPESSSNRKLISMPGSCFPTCRLGSWQRVLWPVLTLFLLVGSESTIATEAGAGFGAKPASAISSKKHQPQTSTSPPKCPPAGLPSLQPSNAQSRHTVILSWNASTHSNKPQSVAVGYCLYRSKDLDAIQKSPTCAKCQRLNETPVVATSCVDDLVENQATYYYVATALNADGHSSFPSNQATANIPKDDQTGPATGTSPPPQVCRGPFANNH